MQFYPQQGHESEDSLHRAASNQPQTCPSLFKMLSDNDRPNLHPCLAQSSFRSERWAIRPLRMMSARNLPAGKPPRPDRHPAATATTTRRTLVMNIMQKAEKPVEMDHPGNGAKF